MESTVNNGSKWDESASLPIIKWNAAVIFCLNTRWIRQKMPECNKNSKIDIAPVILAIISFIRNPLNFPYRIIFSVLFTKIVGPNDFNWSVERSAVESDVQFRALSEPPSPPVRII